MYLEELYQCLVDEARMRVKTGAVTERALARQCGLSQPHMHNVLKNIRVLSTGSASRLMHALDLNIPQLVWHRQMEGSSGVCAVPMLRNRLGPGTSLCLSSFSGYVPFPAGIVERLVTPVAARLGADLVMPKALSCNDLALLDQNSAARTLPGAESCWVVSENGAIRIRYVRMGGTKLYVANEQTVNQRAKWDVISLQGKNILDIIKARIVWVGRDLESIS